MSDAIRAVILGIIEGVTEFLPVSSTGHLLLAERFFGLGEGAFWDSFTVLIQLGAILAIVGLYFRKLWDVAIGLFTGDAYARRFVIGVLVAFLPAVVVGLVAGKYIKSVLFNPWVVCFTLIVGGAILLWVDKLDLKPREHDATKFPLLMYLYIGIAQCVAMRESAGLADPSNRDYRITDLHGHGGLLLIVVESVVQAARPSSLTGLRRMPMPEISISTVSPPFIHSGGVR